MDDRSQTLIRLAALAAGKPHTFALRPGADALTEIAARQDLLALRKLSFTGTLVPQGRSDWRLEARLGATVVQPCVVTLAPVTTRIDEPVHRTYLARMPELPAADEAEMPEDDSIEKLPETLDLAQVMEEALALALPLFPRAADAELGEAVFTEPGKAPLRDEALKPFSGLADLKKRLEEE